MKTIKVRIPLVEYLQLGYSLENGDKLILKPEYVGVKVITVDRKDCTQEHLKHLSRYLIEVDVQIIKQPNKQS